jgi:hypothetical protein
MPLVGGGGAGNIAGGSNPAGTGSTINYVGEFAYLHSGSVSVNNTDTTLGKFATQAEIIDSKIQFHYTEDASDDMIYTVKINNEIVVQYIVNGSKVGASDPDTPIYLVIPPFSTVEFIAKNGSSSTGRSNNVTLRGRLYA